MIGAIIGDIVGSRFEWNNHRSKDFDLMPHQCFFTDDSIMSLAICDALMRCQQDFEGEMKVKTAPAAIVLDALIDGNFTPLYHEDILHRSMAENM